MFHLLSIIISYGAFLLLLMPSTVTDVILTAVMFCLGIGLIVYKKIHKVAFWKNKQYILIGTSILSVVGLGLSFYNRWLPVSQMRAIAALLHMPIEIMLLIASLMLSGFSIYFLYVMSQIIVKKPFDTNPHKYFEKNVVSCMVVSVVTVMIAQIMIDIDILSMGYIDFMWGVLIVSAVILFLYCLVGKMIPAIFLPHQDLS